MKEVGAGAIGERSSYADIRLCSRRSAYVGEYAFPTRRASMSATFYRGLPGGCDSRRTSTTSLVVHFKS